MVELIFPERVGRLGYFIRMILAGALFNFGLIASMLFAVRPLMNQEELLLAVMIFFVFQLMILVYIVLFILRPRVVDIGWDMDGPTMTLMTMIGAVTCWLIIIIFFIPSKSNTS